QLSSSVVELGALFEWFSKSDATLIVVEQEIDTSDGSGQFAAGLLSSVAGSERSRRVRKTRPGLEAARIGAQSKRPAVADIPDLRNRIMEMRDSGMTLQAIADQLNEEG